MPISAPSEISREFDRVFLLIGGVSLLLLAGITIAMVFFVIKFSRKRAHTTAQFEGHALLEITWIVIPTIIVMWMFFVGYGGFKLIRTVPENAMVIQVTGKQWSWSFNYPDEKIKTTEMVVPVNTPVKVELTAPPKDVLHSFYIPDFRVKEDVVPGRNTYLWFESDRTGIFHIFCAEFCGKDHSQMLSQLRVVSQEEYRKWVKDMVLRNYKPLEFAGIQDPNHPAFGPADLNIDSQALFATYCVSCHGANGDGSGLPGLARNFTALKDWKKSAKVTDIYRTLTDGLDGTQMRPFPDLTPWQRVALAHYVRHFSKEPLPTDTQEEYDKLLKDYSLDKMQGPKETIPIEQAMKNLVREAQQGASPPLSP